MRHTLPVVLLFLSCASPAPSTYERGTPARPAPAPTRPGVGLPLPGQPHSNPEVQPHPRPKRYLPPEPDGRPGIWASDEPTQRPLAFILLEPVEMPDGKEEGLARRHMTECANDMNKRADLARPPPTTHFSDMRKDVRKCLAHSLMAACLNLREMQYKSRGPDTSRYGGMEPAIRLNKRAMERACEDREVAALAAREYGVILPGWVLPW